MPPKRMPLCPKQPPKHRSLRKWTDDEIEQLMDAISYYPCLYEKGDKHYMDPEVKANARSTFSALFPDCSASDVEAMWTKLRDKYSKVRRDLASDPPTGSGSEVLRGAELWPHYASMTQFDGAIKQRKSRYTNVSQIPKKILGGANCEDILDVTDDLPVNVSDTTNEHPEDVLEVDPDDIYQVDKIPSDVEEVCSFQLASLSKGNLWESSDSEDGKKKTGAADSQKRETNKDSVPKAPLETKKKGTLDSPKLDRQDEHLVEPKIKRKAEKNKVVPKRDPEEEDEGKSCSKNAIRMRESRKKLKTDSSDSDVLLVDAVTKLANVQSAAMTFHASQPAPKPVAEDPVTSEWVLYGGHYGRKVAMLPEEQRDDIRFKMESVLFECKKKNRDEE